MAPKKKSKANKLAKMTDEERARYLQHRADIEEEARRRKQELISRYFKNKLNKEEVFSRINFAKINQNWRFILRKIKVKEMHHELELLIQSFTRMTDSKNAVISRLMSSLDEAEDQYSRMLQSHMEMISHFLSMSTERLNLFRDNFEQQKDSLVEQWENEFQCIEFNHKESEYKLKLIAHHQSENMKNYVKKSTTSKAHKINFLRLKLCEDIDVMKTLKQHQLEDIWNEFRSVFTDYVNYHNPKIQEYQMLRQKDAIFRKEINQHTDQILEASDIINQQQLEWENLKEDLEFNLKHLRQKRDNMSLIYAKEKSAIMEHHANDRERFTNLSVESSNAVKKLEKNLSKLKKITQLESTCQKYETEAEKVLPWNNIESLLQSNKPIFDDELMKDIKTLDLLDNFWFKVNRVIVHNSALKAECNNLKQENKYLKHCLKSLLLEAALGDLKGSNAEILGRPTSTKMYRISANTVGCEPIIKRPVTCIEGNTCNAVVYEQRMNKWKSIDIEAQKIIVRRHCW